MAISGIAKFGQTFGRVTQSSYTTQSWTPSANKLELFAVMNYVNAGSATVPTLSGNGVTWVQVATVIISASYVLTLFRALAPGATAGTTVIDFGGVNQDFCACVVSEFSGIDQSGTNGSGAIVQSVTDHPGGGTLSESLTLAAFANAANGVYAVVWPNNTETSGAAGSGYTLLNGTVFGSDGLGLDIWRSDNNTTPNVTWTPNTSNMAAIALELKAAGVTPDDDPWNVPIVQPQVSTVSIW